MSNVIQHKSVVATTRNVSLTLDSPITAGNLLVAVVGYSVFISITGFSDDGGPSSGYQLDAGYDANPYNLEIYSEIAPSSSTYTLTVDFSTNNGSVKHLHLFEVSNCFATDKVNINSQVTSSPSVGLISDTNHAAELVLAAFLDLSHSSETFTAGSGYTAGELTNSSGFSMFSEFKEITSVGQPTATASIPDTDTVNSVIVTFYGTGGSGGGGTNKSTTFLGSVTEVNSDGDDNGVFLGTVSVISQVPSGEPNPYLGKVRVVTAPAGRPNPSLGKVVVVSSAPTDDSNPFLGQVAAS